MTSLARTSAGTILYVGNAPATFDAAGYAAVTYTQVAEIVNIGSLGKKYNLVKHNPIDTRTTIKRRGSYDNGQLQLKVAQVADSGQTFLRTALASDNSISIKIALPDGKINYVTAQVMSFITDIGSVDQILAATIELELDNDIVIV